VLQQYGNAIEQKWHLHGHLAAALLRLAHLLPARANIMCGVANAAQGFPLALQGVQSTSGDASEARCISSFQIFKFIRRAGRGIPATWSDDGRAGKDAEQHNKRQIHWCSHIISSAAMC
jgi:hypothetical protein